MAAKPATPRSPRATGFRRGMSFMPSDRSGMAAAMVRMKSSPHVIAAPWSCAKRTASRRSPFLPSPPVSIVSPSTARPASRFRRRAMRWKRRRRSTASSSAAFRLRARDCMQRRWLGSVAPATIERHTTALFITLRVRGYRFVRAVFRETVSFFQVRKPVSTFPEPALSYRARNREG
jgi:hypothetical protein